MNIRNLLLAGTAATVLAAPTTLAHAQSEGAQSDTPIDAAQFVIPEQCLDLELEELETCLAELGLEMPEGLLEEGEPTAPPETPEEAPAEEEVAPAPEPEPQVDLEAEPSLEPEAEPEAEPTEQFVLPEQCQDLAPEEVQACLESLQLEQQGIVPEPEPEVEPEPEMLPEQEAPAEQIIEQAPEEQAPAPQERPETLEAPAEEEAQPEQMVEPEVEAETLEAPQGLSAAVSTYDAAAVEFRSAVEGGGDITEARRNLLAAQAELEAACAAIGMDDLEACLATFGISAEIISPEEIEAAGTIDAEVEAEAAEEREGGIVPEEGVIDEVVPEGVESDAIAPLLDSAKDALTVTDEAAPEEPVETEAQPQAEAPAPQSDADAQSTLQAVDIEPITAEEGTRREAPMVLEGDDEGEAEVVARVESELPTNLDVVEQRGLSIVFQFNNNLYIDTPDTDRLYYENDQDYYIEDLPNGRTREVILRADGSRIVTIRNRYGEIVRRSRIEPDGTEILLVYVDERYNRYDPQGRWIDPGSQLPPLILTIPAQEYVLDASVADAARIEAFLYQPPVEQIQRYYTLDEVKRSARIRDMVRRLEIGDLTFETDSAAILPDQLGVLSAVANAMLDLLAQNPAETFLIEGHTDAVGSDLYNLELSDRRAESVAYALTRVYGIPAENLATQGYGERYLKVNTPFDERINRRVTIRRITPLITPVAEAPAG